MSRIIQGENGKRFEIASLRRSEEDLVKSILEASSQRYSFNGDLLEHVYAHFKKVYVVLDNETRDIVGTATVEIIPKSDLENVLDMAYINGIRKSNDNLSYQEKMIRTIMGGVREEVPIVTHYVNPESRSFGIGKELVDHTERYLTQEDHNRIYVKSDSRSANFYLDKLGFTCIPLENDRVDSPQLFAAILDPNKTFDKLEFGPNR